MFQCVKLMSKWNSLQMEAKSALIKSRKVRRACCCESYKWPSFQGQNLHTHTHKSHIPSVEQRPLSNRNFQVDGLFPSKSCRALTVNRFFPRSFTGAVFRCRCRAAATSVPRCCRPRNRVRHSFLEPLSSWRTIDASHFRRRQHTNTSNWIVEIAAVDYSHWNHQFDGFGR